MKHRNITRQMLMLLLMSVFTLFSVPLHASEDSMRDIDGNGYHTITVGKQVWTAENLRVSRYRNGEAIRHAATREEWLDAAAKSEGAWCYFDNDPANGKKFGRLYNWYAVNDPRGLAPKGWHVPTDREWSALTAFLGGEAVSGGKMKEAGRSLWSTPNEAATNSSGFSALPGGLRGIDGVFAFGAQSAYFWTSAEHSPSLGWYRVLNYHTATVVRSGEEKIDGMSVRCVRD
ncbi:MAG: fibrobacter succinogenes major paralogous domain-containing protein [Chlorobium sp.]|uniref:fibrobacter succinogenes major paralogous domain-containing protein n=1 Tax=Chlorobium sp. TaxID=1095 RepID=UPI0025B90A84|nr:fibrobacter succinogenes major paralogous domain-containing protein [Chlorobium sp.]MCF8383825.1 fibrobacter succinogenes major paralogous domain-containing protein [Chlorobium sp.]